MSEANLEPLRRQVEALGIKPGDALMLHASMRAVGVGADALLDVLEGAVSPGGTLLMLLAADNDEPFDAATSPAWGEIGILAEVFRKRPGVLVNAHPIARFAAWGTGAKALIHQPPIDNYYGPDSPLHRLMRRGGKVLRLGADWDSVTMLHYAEYLATIKDKRRVMRQVEVRAAGSMHTMVVRCLDDENGIRDWPGVDYFELITKAFVESGAGTQGAVGGAQCECLPSEALVAFGIEWMEREFGGRL